MAPLTAASCISDHAGELIPDNDLGVVWGSGVTSWPGETQPIEGSRYAPGNMPLWGKKYKDWMRENYRRLYSMYAQTSNFPSKKYYCDLDPNVKDKFGQPALAHHARLDRARQGFRGVPSADQAQIAKEMGVQPLWEEPGNPAFTCQPTKWAPIAWVTIPIARWSTSTAKPTSAKICLPRRRAVPHLRRIQPDANDHGPRLSDGRPHGEGVRSGYRRLR